MYCHGFFYPVDHYHSCKNLISAKHLTIWLVANLKQNLNSFQPNLSFNRSERLSSIKMYAGTSTISWSRFWLIVLRLLRKSISQNVILKRKKKIYIVYVVAKNECWLTQYLLFPLDDIKRLGDSSVNISHLANFIHVKHKLEIVFGRTLWLLCLIIVQC